MPVYTYQCRDCAELFDELILSSGAEKSLICPKCGSASLERRMAAFATISHSAPECGSGACSSCRHES